MFQLLSMMAQIKGCRRQVVSLVKTYSVGVPLKAHQDSVTTWLFLFSTYPRAPIKMSNIPRLVIHNSKKHDGNLLRHEYIYLRGRIQVMHCTRSLTHFDLYVTAVSPRWHVVRHGASHCRAIYARTRSSRILWSDSIVAIHNCNKCVKPVKNTACEYQISALYAKGISRLGICSFA